jgi:hypothetical protein
MANFREHVSVSGMLGLGYGFGAVAAFGFTPVQGALAGCLTGVSGMLPDLDSDNGRPIRELFGLVGAVAPLLLVNRVVQLTGVSADPETVILLIICMYVLIKYGGAMLIGRLSVHRGMFHSIPALLIAAETVYLGYPNPRTEVRLLMAGGVAAGFLSHLLLDELYSIHMKDMQIRLKKSSGTAVKMVGDRFLPNVFTYTLAATLTCAVLQDAGWLDQSNSISQESPPGEAPLPRGSSAPVHQQLTTELGAPADPWGADVELNAAAPAPETAAGPAPAPR